MNLKRLTLFVLIQLLLIEPVFPALSFLLGKAQAEDEQLTETTVQYDELCLAAVDAWHHGQPIPEIEAPDLGSSTDSDEPAQDTGNPEDQLDDSEPDPGEMPFYTYDLDNIRMNDLIPEEIRLFLTSKEYIDEVITYHGGVGLAYYKAPADSVLGNAGKDMVVVCRNALQPIQPVFFSPTTPITPTMMEYLRVAKDPTPRIAFLNEMDRYAILGERCQTLEPSKSWTDNQSPCLDFNIEDDVFANELWDAPKVDRRVIDTLLYLVTPTALGGAGREYLRVKKVIQPSKANDLDVEAVQIEGETNQPEGQAASVGLDETQSPATPEEADTKPSSYWVNSSDPPHRPKRVSRSIMIDEVDKVRATTKIEYKRVFGNNTVEYKFDPPFPVKVAWQSDDGIAQNPLPDLTGSSMLVNARILTNAMIVNLLTKLGLGDLEIDVSNVEINNYTDVASLIGQSLLEHLLGSPKGSLKGYNLASTLQSIGLSYLEQQLGLVPGTMTDPNPLDRDNQTADFDILVEEIGRATIEYTLGFPHGSLRSKSGTSKEVLESVARVNLEQEVFKVRLGTLTPSENAPLKTIGDLLERLGEGAIEQRFSLPKQSMRVNSYEDARNSSFKAGLLFPPDKSDSNGWSEDDYAMSDYLSNQLSLIYVPYLREDGTSAGTNMYGFRESDFNLPSVKTAPSDFRKFKRIVGSRVIESTLGLFRREGLDQLSHTVSTGTPGSRTFENDYTFRFDLRPSVWEEQLLQADGTVRTNSYNWCSLNEYVGSDLFKKFDPANSTVDTPGYKNAIDSLATDNFTLDSSYNMFSVPCSDQNTRDGIVSDLDLAESIKAMMLNPDPLDTVELLNRDKAPQFNDFREPHQAKRYQSALVMYYNLAANHTSHPLNYVAPYQTTGLNLESQVGTPAEEDNPDEKRTVAQILQQAELQPGGNDLAARLNLLEQKLTEVSEKFATNLSDIVGSGQVNSAIVERLNLITSKPAKAKYEEQYSLPEYNGLLFIISDIYARLGCASSGKRYQLTENKQAHGCVTVAGDNEPEGQDVYFYNQARSKLDSLLKGVVAASYASLIGTLDSGTYVSTAGFTNQSAMSVMANLPSQTYRTDENRRFQLDQPNYNQDLIRALIAPDHTDSGVVSQNSSIEIFFEPDDQGRTLLGETGKVYAARKFSTDKLDERTFAAKLKSDFDQEINGLRNSFDVSEGVMEEMGLSDDSVVDRGLLNGDFQRIFMLGLPRETYARVGKEELARVIWERTGAAEKIKDSAQYQSLIKQLRQISQQVDFYRSRINRITSLAESINDDFERLGSSFDALTREFNALNEETNNERNVVSIDRIRTLTRRYEPVLSKGRKQLEREGTQTAKSVLAKLQEIQHLTEEIAAGRQLPRSDTNGNVISTGLSKPAGKKADNPCFTKDYLMGIFTSTTDLFKRIADFALEVGGCQVDSQLSLPRGSMYGWYLIGKQTFPESAIKYHQDERDYLPEYTDDGRPGTSTVVPSSAKFYSLVEIDVPGGGKKKVWKLSVPSWNKETWGSENLYIIIGAMSKLRYTPDGREDTSVNPKTVVDSLQSESAATINSYKSHGQRIIQSAVLARLASMIPGFSTFARQYKLTADDFARIMQGDMRPLIAKIGGTTIDQLFNFPLGTGASLIYPICYTNTGARAPCSNDPNQPGTDPDNMRLQTLAKIGLQKLGLEIPNFPRYFNLAGGGNLLEGWGNAVISQYLNLAPNSFKGKIIDVPTNTNPASENCQQNALRCQNSISTLNQAFGLSPTPALRQLDTIVSQIERLLRSQAADTDIPIDYRVVLAAINGTMVSAMKAKVEAVKQTLTLDIATNQADISGENGYWTNLNSSTPRQKNGVAFMAIKNRETFKETVDWLWKMENLEVLPSSTRAAVRVIILRNLGEFVPAETIEPLLDLPENTLASLDGFFLPDFPEASDLALTDRYLSLIRYFQGRLTQLDQKFGYRSDGPASFTALLKGQAKAEDLSRVLGGTQTVTEVLGAKFDQWINSNRSPAWLREINYAFTLLTADSDICGTSTTGIGGGRNPGVGLGGFLTNLLIGNNDSVTCSFRGLEALNINEIFYSTAPNYVKLREFLFDKLLGQAAVRHIEEQAGLRSGTLKKIIANPKEGRRVLITEGVLNIGNKIFGTTNQNETCQNRLNAGSECARSVVINAFKEAFFAGFCDNIKTNKCDTKWNQSRSSKKFSEITYAAIDAQLSTVGKRYLGVAITRADLSLFIHGDSRFFALVSLQYVVNSLNQKLFGKGTRNRNNAKYFSISYADVRESVGLPSQATTRLSFNEAERNFLVSQTCSGDRSCSSQSLAQLRELYQQQIRDQRILLLEEVRAGSGGRLGPGDEEYLQSIDLDGNGTISDEEYETYIALPLSEDIFVKLEANYAINSATPKLRDDYLRQKRQDSADKVRYAIYDMVALSLDPNIPPNFSRRLLGKSDIARTDAIAQYLFNSLLNSTSDLGKFLQKSCATDGGDAGAAANCYGFWKNLYFAITGNPTERANAFRALYQNQVILGRVDRLLNDYFEKTFNFRLPEGSFSGIVAWGIDGFKAESFNKSGIIIDPANPSNLAKPIGYIWQEYGYGQLAKFIDKSLGLKTGTGIKIITLAQKLLTLQRLVAYGQQLKQGVAAINEFYIYAGMNGADQDLLNEIDEMADAEEASLAQNDSKINSLKAAIAALAAEIIVGLYSEQLANLDKDLNLPAGTSQMILAAGLTYGIAVVALGVSGAAAAAAAFGPAFWAFLGIQLIFGVVSVVITPRATGDGYYPFYKFGKGSADRPPYSEYPSPDRPTGEFDQTKSTTYKTGIKTVAREKVRGLIIDLLLLPSSDWARRRGYSVVPVPEENNPNLIKRNLWVHQLFTYYNPSDPSEANPFRSRDYFVQELINRRTPHDSTDPDWGYGLPEYRCSSIDYNPATGTTICHNILDIRSGMFSVYNPAVVDAIHIRW